MPHHAQRQPGCDAAETMNHTLDSALYLRHSFKFPSYPPKVIHAASGGLGERQNTDEVGHKHSLQRLAGVCRSLRIACGHINVLINSLVVEKRYCTYHRQHSHLYHHGVAGTTSITATIDACRNASYPSRSGWCGLSI